MSFYVANFSLLIKKLNPGISRDDDQFCPVIPGYGKASEILNPNVYIHICKYKYNGQKYKYI